MKANRIAVYGRVSTVAQNHASQLREVRAYVRRRWPKAEIIEYLEKASGAKFSRDALDAMMSEVRKGRIDRYKLDRLAQFQHSRNDFELKIRTVPSIAGDTPARQPPVTPNTCLAVAKFDALSNVSAGLAAAASAPSSAAQTLDGRRPLTISPAGSWAAKSQGTALSRWMYLPC